MPTGENSITEACILHHSNSYGSFICSKIQVLGVMVEYTTINFSI